MSTIRNQSARKTLFKFALIAGACLLILGLTTQAASSWASVEYKASPNFGHNISGLSFGSAALAQTPDAEPDLILVIATNGVEGYVYKTDLNSANGTNESKTFASPEQAVKWQETKGLQDRTISVYDQTGNTILGEFVVSGTLSQQRAARELNK